MGTKERRDRERRELRKKILAAARELFVEQGYDAVTMRKIAQAIEYSPTAIYLHFKDKMAVMRALCDQDYLALAKRFRKIADLRLEYVLCLLSFAATRTENDRLS